MPSVFFVVINKPQTSNLKSQILNLKSQILNLKSQILNLKSQILNLFSCKNIEKKELFLFKKNN